MAKKILVTGGAGFIGSHIVERLLDMNMHVVCMDNLFTGSMSNIAQHLNKSHFEFVNWDVVEPYDFGVSEIYNFACPATLRRIREDPIHCFKTSVYGAVNALELCVKYNAKICEASSSEIYGDPLQHPQKESYWGNSNPVGERACYDEGKRAAETLCNDYHTVHGVDARIVRIFNTYGPRMQIDDGRVVGNFIVEALRGQDLSIYGDGTDTRSFCYVDDLVDGIIKFMNYDGPYLGPVNFGNPVEISVMELAQMIINMTDSKSLIKILPELSDDPRRRRPDIHIAQSTIGWSPNVSLEAGLQRTIEYFRDRLSSGCSDVQTK
jgi:UDP-glucuronate decarboxylase